MKKKIKKAFNDRYHCDPSLIIRSPGRVNIIGEHTDYNNGFVLPAAIDKAAYIAIKLRDDNQIHLTAQDLNETFSVDINEIKPLGDISWPNYILGAVAQFKKIGIAITGFNVLLCSNVPIGAGLSSSAAVECAVIYALNDLFQTKLDKFTMVKMAQKTEHEFAGVLCGVMDMFASMMGRKDHVIKLDCRSLEYEYVPFKMEGVKMVLLNTNVKHSLASSEYNTRRTECKQAVELIQNREPQITSLRDATEVMLDKYVLPENRLLDKRSRFIVQEIERLQQACNDLQQGNLSALGKKMYATHEGLSKMYDVSCKELDFLVKFVKNNETVLGARMMGGGFGGCTINLVKEDKIEELIAAVKPAYERATNLPLTYYIAGIEEGTSIVK